MKTRNTFSRLSSTKPSTLPASPVIATPVQAHLYSSPPSHNPSLSAYVVHKVLQTRKYPLDRPCSKRWCWTRSAQNMWKINPALISNSSNNTNSSPSAPAQFFVRDWYYHDNPARENLFSNSSGLKPTNTSSLLLSSSLSTDPHFTLQAITSIPVTNRKYVIPP